MLYALTAVLWFKRRKWRSRDLQCFFFARLAGPFAATVFRPFVVFWVEMLGVPLPVRDAIRCLILASGCSAALPATTTAVQLETRSKVCATETPLTPHYACPIHTPSTRTTDLYCHRPPSIRQKRRCSDWIPSERHAKVLNQSRLLSRGHGHLQEERNKRACLRVYHCMTNSTKRVANNHNAKHVPLDLTAPCGTNRHLI